MTGQHAGPRRDWLHRYLAWSQAAPQQPAPGTEAAQEAPGLGYPLPRRQQADARAVAAGLRARSDLTGQADIPTRILPALRDWTPMPPAPPRLPAPQAAAMLPAVRYPDCGGTAPAGSPEDYAAALRHVGRITGTATRWEDPGAWPRYAIETGSEAAA